MTENTVEVEPTNSLVLVMDPAVGVVPTDIDGDKVVATDSALLIPTMLDFEGPTTVTLLDSATAQNDLQLRWDGWLKTQGRLCVLDVLDEELLSCPAPPTVHVQVWANSDREPDQIVVQVVLA